MARKRISFGDQLRRQIERAEITRYRLALDCEIHHASLSRFMRGDTGLSFAAVERIVERLELELRKRE